MGSISLLASRLCAWVRSISEYARVKETAIVQCNTYTTTLHAINSAIVKIGKLTVATKVYLHTTCYILLLHTTYYILRATYYIHYRLLLTTTYYVAGVPGDRWDDSPKRILD